MHIYYMRGREMDINIKDILRKDHKLSKNDKFLYSVIAIFSVFIIILAFNVIIAPLLFLVFVLFIVNNDNNKITLHEKTFFFIVVLPFLFYVLSARLCGMYAGLLIGILTCIKGTIYIWFIWRRK